MSGGCIYQNTHHSYSPKSNRPTLATPQLTFQMVSRACMHVQAPSHLPFPQCLWLKTKTVWSQQNGPLPKTYIQIYNSEKKDELVISIICI